MTNEDRVILARLEAEGRRWSFVREQYTPREWKAIKRGCEDTVNHNRLREEHEWSAPWRATHGMRVELDDGVEEILVWLRTAPLVDCSKRTTWCAYTETSWPRRT